ncbi:unnamed protein product [Thelazia callipaeda]|uniref:BTB_2 domain-containing protein n=1 Tax=Thelazia callipaeda TaxID=103827 RepID=A0A0N5CTI6_THECL|nr:unnamed protein product [Thelazia callipaeda]
MTSSIQETSITKNDSYGVKSSNHNDDAIMPVKLHSAYRYTHASELRIAVNGFTLDMSKAIDKVYKFELKMYGIKGDGKEKELSRGPRNDVALSIRHQALWSIYHQMLKSHEYLFGKNLIKYFYDCGINFYSVDELWNREEGEKELKINIELLCPTSRDFLGKQTVRLVARLLPCGEVFMHNKTVTETDHNRSLLQFLEIATSQMMFDKGTHLCFRNKAYEYSSDQNAEIYSGKVVVSGMEKNIRLVGNSWDEATPIVQIDGNI